MVNLSSGTNYTPTLLKLAKKTVAKLFKSNCNYKKAGVILTGLQTQRYHQENLFASATAREKEIKLMNIIVDHLNQKFGQGTINFGLTNSQSSWRTKSQRRSARFTTQWNDLPIVKAGSFIN